MYCKRPILVLITAIVVVIAFWFFVIPIPTPRSDQDFKTRWTNAHISDRQHLLPWLLNKEAERYQIYPIHETRIDGLDRADVKELMGKPDRSNDSWIEDYKVDKSWGEITMYSYDLGMVERDLVGSMIVPWRDYLRIVFNEEGAAVFVEITE